MYLKYPIFLINIKHAEMNQMKLLRNFFQFEDFHHMLHEHASAMLVNKTWYFYERLHRIFWKKLRDHTKTNKKAKNKCHMRILQLWLISRINITM